MASVNGSGISIHHFSLYNCQDCKVSWVDTLPPIPEATNPTFQEDFQNQNFDKYQICKSSALI